MFINCNFYITKSYIISKTISASFGFILFSSNSGRGQVSTLELIIMETYVNRITLISVYVADHNCCMIIYTQFSKTRR